MSRSDDAILRLAAEIADSELGSLYAQCVDLAATALSAINPTLVELAKCTGETAVITAVSVTDQ